MTAGASGRLLRSAVLLLVTMLLLAVASAGLYPWVYKQFEQEPFAVKESPDGRFRLEYHAIPFLPFRPHEMIGMGCTDCPGYLKLVDTERKRTLAEKYFQTRHELTSGVEWRRGEVRVKRFATWSLPR